MKRCANWASPRGCQPDLVISTDTYIHGSVAIPLDFSLRGLSTRLSYLGLSIQQVPSLTRVLMKRE